MGCLLLDCSSVVEISDLKWAFGTDGWQHMTVEADTMTLQAKAWKKIAPKR
jgi:hypothetical protein